jgi:hypothetical protein
MRGDDAAMAWESEASVRCLVTQGLTGARKTRRVEMTLEARGGNVTQAWSVDTAGLSSMRGQNQGTRCTRHR